MRSASDGTAIDAGHSPGPLNRGNTAEPAVARASFDTAGFALVPGVLPEEECAALADLVQPGPASAGTRRLLDEPWCVGLADRLRSHPVLAALVPPGHVAVQCTYFEKSTGRNWLVPLHQDLSIPVRARVDAPGLSGWSEKEGGVFVHAPVPLLEQLVAVRLHLDDCTEKDGPLKVVPGSHDKGLLADDDAVTLRNASPVVACTARRGAALAMRPLLLHASSKTSGQGRRRVLHFVFGPREPGHGLRWRQTCLPQTQRST